MIARLANRASDLAFLPGTERLWARRLRGRALAPLYHRVDPPGRYPFLDRGGSPTLASAELAKDLAFWRELGARFGTFADLRTGTWPGPDAIGIVICFDDGFRSVYVEGLPVVEAAGARATIFQTTAMIAPAPLLWEHALYLHLGADADRRERDRLRSAASRAEIAERLERVRAAVGAGIDESALAAELYPEPELLLRAAVRGHEIASHGHGHEVRSRLSDEAFEAELVRSSAILRDLLGEAPRAFSYPFGGSRPGDGAICLRHYDQAAVVRPEPVDERTPAAAIPRCTWPGPPKSQQRWRRWLLTGRI